MFTAKEQKVFLFLFFLIIVGIFIIFLQSYQQKEIIEVVKGKELVEVCICGKVVSPGIYKFLKNKTLEDILKLAGIVQGASGKLSFTVLNSNEFLNIPVNINTATQDELETLPSIGPKLASNIVDYRKRHGNFRSKEEITKVKGIGTKKFQLISDSIFIRENKKGEIPYNLELELKGMKKEGVYKIKKDATISDILDIANCRHSAESRHSGSGRGSANGYNRKINLKFVKLEVK